MSKRCYLYVQSFISLFIGFLIYIFFRKGTHIHDILQISDRLYINVSFWGEDFIRYAMPDFLWAYGLSMSLFGIFYPNNYGEIVILILTAVIGILWEFLQLLSIVTGTFNILDCLMYSIASIVSLYIYKRQRRKTMKKLLSIILAISLVGTFMIFAIGSGSSNGTTTEQAPGAATENNNSNSLGKYNVDILSCRLAKDYEGKDVVIVKYNFTNSSNDDATSFMLALSDHVYQDGIGLNKAYILNESAKYSADNQSKQIKKGASIEVEIAYELNDNTTDIVVEVGELISFDNNLVSRTFTIA